MNKVYIALLNQGWVKPAHINMVMGFVQSGIPFHLTYPSLKPASHNRNQSVLDFLKTDYTHYLSIDDDVVPFKNPFDLLKHDKDIIGLPAPIRQKGRVIWTAFKKNKGRKDYSNIKINNKKGIFKCDAVGSGIILIKREVLEKVKSPFSREWNEDGLATLGLDINFCRKAKREGFNVYSAPDYKCEHYKEIELTNLIYG